MKIEFINNQVRATSETQDEALYLARMAITGTGAHVPMEVRAQVRAAKKKKKQSVWKYKHKKECSTCGKKFVNVRIHEMAIHEGKKFGYQALRAQV